MDTLEQAFREERAFIARCTDVAMLLERMTDYRAYRREALATGNIPLRLRADDLLELAEDRIVTLKAEAQRRTIQADPLEVATGSRPQGGLPRATDPPNPPRPTPPERLSTKGEPVERDLGVTLARTSAATSRAVRDVSASVRFPGAVQPQMVEARAAALQPHRAETLAARRPVGSSALPPRATTPARPEPLLVPERVIGAPGGSRPPGLVSPPASTVSQLETGPAAYPAGCGVAVPTGPMASGDSPPATTALTGADLLHFRQRAGLTQREAAIRLGVAHGTVGKAEAAAHRPLSPALAEALTLASQG
jgi:hypothetical protein